MTPKARLLALISPLFLIPAGHLTARVLLPVSGAWTWVPLLAVDWALMVLAIRLAGAGSLVRAAYRRPSGWRWWIAGLIAGLIPAPILLLHLGLLHMHAIVACWLAVALINPFVEESYWRCLLGEATRTWPGWISCFYSSVLFTASHPLQWGVFSLGNRDWQVGLSLMLMGLVWSAMYRRTRSLRAGTFSHVLVDLGNMSVWVFMNLYVPNSHYRGY